MRTSELQRILVQLAGRREANRRPAPLQPAVQELLRTGATSEGRRLFHDELTILAAVAEEIDKETDANSAWDMVADISRIASVKRAPYRERLARAVRDNLHKCTVGFLDIKTRQAASGTLVSIEGRVFVATVAHAVPQRPQGRISFISAREAKLGETTPKILACARRVPARPDVAFLELPADFVTEVLQKEPITPCRVTPCGAALKGRMVYLFGYPSGLTQTHMMTPNRGHIVFCAQCYCHPPIIPEDWEFVEESTDARQRPDPTMDVFLPYLMDEEMLHFEENPKPDVGRPEGLSGGGLWQLVGGEDTIWAPHNYHLIAIQSRWPRQGRHLQATQVIHWLRLVHAECPELRSALEGQFPEQSFA